MKNDFEIRGDVTAIFLRRKDGTVLETLIDTADLGLIDSFAGTWGVVASHDGKYLTARIAQGVGPERKWMRLHQIILPTSAPFVIDHINHNPLDNRRSNFRAVSVTVNGLNRRGVPAGNRSGILNVSWDSTGRNWFACIKVDGKNRAIGRFQSKVEAQVAAQTARAELMAELLKDERHVA